MFQRCRSSTLTAGLWNTKMSKCTDGHKSASIRQATNGNTRVWHCSVVLGVHSCVSCELSGNVFFETGVWNMIPPPSGSNQWPAAEVPPVCLSPPLPLFLQLAAWCGGRPSSPQVLLAWQRPVCARAAWDAPRCTDSRRSVRRPRQFPTEISKSLSVKIKELALYKLLWFEE